MISRELINDNNYQLSKTIKLRRRDEMQKIKRTLLLGNIFILVMLLAACNGNVETQIKESQNLETRIIKTVYGDVEIPAKPKRIVAQGYMASLLALGVKPVGAPFWDIDSPHVKHLTSGIEDIGTIDASNLEKILSLKPDLIVTLAYDKELYEQLSKIAPTIVYTENTFMDTRDEIRTFGELLDKQKEAEAWIADFDKTVKEAKQQIKGLVAEDETVSVMGGFEKGIYVYSSGIWRGSQAIYKHLELTPPQRIQELIDANEPIKEISAEVIPEYAGDYIFLDSGNSGQFDRDGALWQSLEAVKNNRVFDLDGDYFWPYDPIAIKAQVEKVAEMIVERNKTTAK